MVRTPPTHVFEVPEATVIIDPADQSIGQLSFLVPAGDWYHFRLSRAALEKLQRQIAQALQASSPKSQ